MKIKKAIHLFKTRPILKRIGKNIYLERKRLGLTQQGLAMLSGLDRPFISDLERGKANPSIFTLNKLAIVLHIKLEQLIK